MSCAAFCRSSPVEFRLLPCQAWHYQSPPGPTKCRHYFHLADGAEW